MYIVILIYLVTFMVSFLSKGYVGNNMNGEFYPAEDVKFLYDLTYEKDGRIIKEQSIFDEQLKIIRDAKKFIILDLFLYNDDYDRKKYSYRNQVEEMTKLLIEKKKSYPNLQIIFISDEINNFYGAYKQKHIKSLEDNGIDVTITDFSDIRDSNPLYSGLYRCFIKWMGSSKITYIKNIFDPQGPKINLRSLLKLLNFKANHRKVLITENCALVASSNPHDPSSNHSNVAIEFYGKAMEDLIKSELGLVKKSYKNIENFKVEDSKDCDIKLRIISEGEIFKALKNNIDRSKKGDEIKIAIFYISDRKILKSLSEASKRGVKINIIADLNKDAFGLEKNGAPNRPALSGLVDKNPKIELSWYESHGEQFHTKFAYFNYKNKNPRIILGSANYTRRNLQNYNLETDVEVEFDRKSIIYKDIDAYYDRIWNNIGGFYSSKFEEHYENSIFLRIIWQIQEITGLCTW